jgi:TonB family protein
MHPVCKSDLLYVSGRIAGYMKTFLITLSGLITISTGWTQIPAEVSGEIRGTINWSGFVLIKGDVTITKGSQLIIAPGTRILFAPGGDQLREGSDKTRCELSIRGTLIARGQGNRKIIFSSAADSPRMGDWYGIQFLYSETGSVLEYCQIEYAHNGVMIKNSQVQISNSEFRYHFNAGVVTELKSNPLLKQCLISENGYAGVVCDLGSTPVLTGNIITQNPIGLIVFGTSKPNLGSLTNDADFNQGRNTISNNEQYDLYNHSNQSILAQNNSWGKDNSSQIDKILYDSADNSKYGKIEYTPVYREQGGRPAINEFAVVVQAGTVSGNAGPQSSRQAAPETRPRTGNRNAATTSPPPRTVEQRPSIPVQDGSLTQNEQTNPLPAAGAATMIPDSINLAAVEEIQPLNSTETTETQISEPVIDYTQVFLEVFIDGGKKIYLERPKLQVTNVLRNVIKKGEIRVKVTVSTTGDIESVSILKGMNTILDTAVLETVSNYKYRPGHVNGHPVRFTTTELFRFE